jgi:hypothetical protein
MKTILSSFLALILLMGATLIATPDAFASTKNGKGSKNGSRGKSRSGSQRNPGRKKTNIPKNPN